MIVGACLAAFPYWARTCGLRAVVGRLYGLCWGLGYFFGGHGVAFTIWTRPDASDAPNAHS